MRARYAKLAKAMREMENACLTGDSSRTTPASIRENGEKETREYFYWLKRQAPMTGMFYDFDDLWNAR